MSPPSPPPAAPTPASSPADAALTDEAVAFCSELIRFDTSNFGEGRARGERDAAEWVAARLSEVGLKPVVLESAPGRASTLVRIPGADRAVPGLLVHGHLDVVPARAEDWSVDPFGGEIRDGSVWGRGAIDMKGTDAMMLAAARAIARGEVAPRRDIVLAWVADEEDTGRYGAGHIVDEHPELLAGVSQAIGEAGGTLTVLPDGGHLYPVACAERGTAWIELTARGSAGHGSRPRADTAITRLLGTLERLAQIDWPLRLIPTTRALLDGLSERLDVRLDPADPELVERLGAAGELLAGTLSDTLAVTGLQAGEKANVIPSAARAVLDGRTLPGGESEFLTAIDAALAPGVTRRFISHQPPIAADPTSPELAVMQAALARHDPGAFVLPCCTRGGTDAKQWSRLGIACYGFAPALAEPVGPDGRSLVHGVDERISVQSLGFGARVLGDYLASTGASSTSSTP